MKYILIFVFMVWTLCALLGAIGFFPNFLKKNKKGLQQYCNACLFAAAVGGLIMLGTICMGVWQFRELGIFEAIASYLYSQRLVKDAGLILVGVIITFISIVSEHVAKNYLQGMKVQ